MVNPELFAAYCDALGGCGTLVRAAVEAILGSIPEGASDAQVMALLLQAYPDELTRHGIIAADLARQFYQEQRDLEDGLETDYTARAAGEIPRYWGIEDVKDAITGAHGMSLGKLPGKAVKRTMQRADQTIYENSRRDPAHPRWAIVPNPNACPWCIMIGSRGFAYRSQATADSQRHGGCKCTPVCDFDTDNPSLVGYDPKGMYDRMMACSERVGAGQDWGVALREAESYYDREWLRTGEVPEIDYTRASRDGYGILLSQSERFNARDYDEENFKVKGNEWRDLFAHDALANAGFAVSVRPSQAIGSNGKVVDGVTNPDIEIGEAIWEIKSVRDGKHSKDNELSFIEQSVRDARKNFRNPYDEKTAQGMGDMRASTKVVVNTRYRRIESSEDEIMREFQRHAMRYRVEIIWIDESGTVTKFPQ